MVRLFLFLFLFLFFTLYFYKINFTFLPVDSVELSFLILVALGVVLVALNEMRLLIFRARCFSFMLIGICLYALLAFRAGNGFVLTLSLLYLAIEFVLFILLFFVVSRYLYFTDIVLIVGFVATFQAVMMFWMYFDSDFKFFYLSFVESSQNILGYYELRRIGLTGFASYSVSAFQAYVACLLVSMILFYKKYRVYFFFCFLLILPSSFMAGRSAMVIYCIYTLFLVFYLAFNAHHRQLMLVLGVLVSCLVSVVYVVVFHSEYVGENYYVAWMLEPFLNLSSGVGLSTRSSDTIASFYFIPSVDTFVFGDWQYVLDDGRYYMDVDAGYMRILLYMGFPLMLLYLMLFVAFFSMLMRLARGIAGSVKVALLAGVVAVFVLNIKGSFFVDGLSLLRLIMIVSVFYCVSQFNRRYGVV